MTDTSISTRAVLERFVSLIDAQDWQGLRALLTDDAVVTYDHDGQVFDADAFVAYNRDYPGRWRLTLEDVVVGGDRAATRTRVTDGEQTYYVAGFATVRDGQVTRLAEVWSSEVVAG